MSLRLPLTDSVLENARRALLRKASTDSGLSVEEGGSLKAFKDGEMGSFAVVGKVTPDARERVVADYDYLDSDGTVVVITAFSHDDETISSIDFWRVDFRPLKAFPEPDDLRLRSIAGVAARDSGA